MTGITHRKFAVAFAYVGTIVMSVLNTTTLNYFIVTLSMLPLSQVGAKYPDWDHDWSNIKDKNTVTFIINKTIHLTGGKHRSWQTHSWDICLGSLVGALVLVNKFGYLIKLDEINTVVASMIIIGFWCGWISHLFSDMLTSGGVRLFFWSKFKVKLVPRKASRLALLSSGILLIGIGVAGWYLEKINITIGCSIAGLFLIITGIKLGNVVFKTGDAWEEYVQRLMKHINFALGLSCIAYGIVISL